MSNQDSNRKHLFISHHHADDASVDDLTGLLGRAGYDIRNSSIRVKPENQRRIDEGRVPESTLRRILSIKIAWSGTVVVLIGSETHLRPWVAWEIEQAHKMGKRIVGVYEHGGQDATVPEALNNYASAIVAWNTESILTAIDGSKNEFQDASGTSRQPVFSGTSSQC